MRFQLLFVGCCIVAAGCNADPRCRRETALLRAEILDLEDKYYLTKAQRDDALAVLDARGETAVAKRIASLSRDSENTPANGMIYGDAYYDGEIIDEGGWVDDGGVMYDDAGQPSLQNQPYDYAPYDFESIDPLPTGPSGNPPAETNEPFPFDLNSPETILPLEPPTGGDPGNDSLPEPGSVPANPASSILMNAPEINGKRSPATSNKRITEIVIQPGPARNEEGPGLSVLIQPKTASGETVLQSGNLTISVNDPAAPSASQRIGFWKFLATETELFFTDESPESRGIELHLPWEQTKPRANEVVVFVRFQTLDGRRLESSSKLQLAKPAAGSPTESELIAGWNNRNGKPSADPVTANRNRVQAAPVSSGNKRVTKPNWRPVR